MQCGRQPCAWILRVFGKGKGGYEGRGSPAGSLQNSVWYEFRRPEVLQFRKSRWTNRDAHDYPRPQAQKSASRTTIRRGDSASAAKLCS
jgi:hypothetical protein